jgi:hypothetical protein
MPPGPPDRADPGGGHSERQPLGAVESTRAVGTRPVDALRVDRTRRSCGRAPPARRASQGWRHSPAQDLGVSPARERGVKAGRARRSVTGSSKLPPLPRRDEGHVQHIPQCLVMAVQETRTSGSPFSAPACALETRQHPRAHSPSAGPRSARRRTRRRPAVPVRPPRDGGALAPSAAPGSGAAWI